MLCIFKLHVLPVECGRSAKLDDGYSQIVHRVQVDCFCSYMIMARILSVRAF